MGFSSGDGTNSFTGSFWGTLLDFDGWTSVGRSGRELLESLNDLKSVKKIGFQFQRGNISILELFITGVNHNCTEFTIITEVHYWSEFRLQH